MGIATSDTMHNIVIISGHDPLTVLGPCAEFDQPAFMRLIEMAE
jgi:hypothetical protein